MSYHSVHKHISQSLSPWGLKFLHVYVCEWMDAQVTDRDTQIYHNKFSDFKLVDIKISFLSLDNTYNTLMI